MPIKLTRRQFNKLAADRFSKPPPSPASLRRTAKRKLDSLRRVHAWECEMRLRYRPGFFIAVQTISEANARENRFDKAKRSARERRVAYSYASMRPLVTPDRVHLTRYSPKELDAHDNLRVALKHVIDGIADALGIDDADMKWNVGQKKSPAGCHGVGVKFVYARDPRQGAVGVDGEERRGLKHERRQPGP